MKKQFCIAKHLPSFIAPKSDYRDKFKCVKYTGEHGIATDTILLLIFQSKVPAMLQNFYTREVSTATFPDVNKVIPLDYKYRITIPASAIPELIGAATAVKGFWGDDIAPVVIENGAEGFRFVAEKPGAKCIFTVNFESDKEYFDLSLSATRLKKIFLLLEDYCDADGCFDVLVSEYPSPVVFSVDGLKIVLTPVRNDWRRG